MAVTIGLGRKEVAEAAKKAIEQVVLYSVEKPEYLELSRKSIAAYSKQDEMRLMEGDFMNGAMAPDQTGPNRPFPEAAHYRTEIEGLYLCGPYMFPGGGASATTGHNVFKIIAEDFGLEKFWESNERGY